MKYFLWIGEQADGPYDKPQLVEMLLSGKITKETLWIPENGKEDWQPVSAIPDLLHVGSPQPAPAASPRGEVNTSDVASVLKLLAILEILASAFAGFMTGWAGEKPGEGWLIAVGGITGGLILIGFASVIDHSYECAQRLRRIEDLLLKADGGKKEN
jgi:hypothetical protein